MVDFFDRMYNDKKPNNDIKVKPVGTTQLINTIPIVASTVPVGEEMFTELNNDDLIQNNNTMKAFIKYRKTKLNTIDDFMDLVDELRRDAYW